MKPEDLLILKEVDAWMTKALETDNISDSYIEYGLSILRNFISENDLSNTPAPHLYEDDE